MENEISIYYAQYIGDGGHIDISYMENGEDKIYTAHPEDEAPLNVLLINLLKEKPEGFIRPEPKPTEEEIRQVEYQAQLNEFNQVKQDALDLVNKQLAILDKPANRLRAERDAAFREKRDASIDEWLAIYDTITAINDSRPMQESREIVERITWGELWEEI